MPDLSHMLFIYRVDSDLCGAVSAGRSREEDGFGVIWPVELEARAIRCSEIVERDLGV